MKQWPNESMVNDEAPRRILIGVMGLEFYPHDDRVGHTIGLVDNDGYIPLLKSIEGHAEDAWPPSPPIQELVEHPANVPSATEAISRAQLTSSTDKPTIRESEHCSALKSIKTTDDAIQTAPSQHLHAPTSKTFLAIGRAGKSHWSLSFEADGNADEGLVVDIACRVNSVPLFIGTTYGILRDRSLVNLQDDQRSLHVSRDKGSGSTLILSTFDSARWMMEPQNDAVKLTDDFQVHKLPATIRWRYRIKVKMS